MKQRFAKLIAWIRTHRTRCIVAAGVLLVGLTAGGAYAAYVMTEPAPIDTTPITIAKKPEQKHYSPLTGEEVANEAETKQLVTAIMIENSLAARPHSGLARSGVVFEAVAEGGITRYIVLYQNQRPKLIGPVRSLRPYFVEWVAPFDAAIAHVGGSARALAEVRNGSYRDIDQFFNAGAYWRASDRYSPHNVYTSFKKLDALTDTKGYKSSKFASWPRADGEPVKKPDATRISINFSSANYNTVYAYNPSSNTYTRHLGGQPHKDREKGNITPSVVIAMKVNERTINDDGPRESITTTGSGQALIFQNGTVTQGKWRKPSKGKQIEWLDGNGNTLELVRGQTWIAAVPNGRGSIAW
ncbi:hypothetical protein CR983_00910 [Candidatus Saccharibacteria bacterium]|nr:MAG: hypothetical protein CR983_00910 [Candidatus Saccharibacteria bacterium]